MPIFIWKGKNRYGDLVGGERSSRSEAELRNILLKEQITVSSVSRKKTDIKIPFLKKEKVKIKDLAVYSRQLSVLIDADLPLIQSLNMLSKQTKNAHFRKVIDEIRKDVEGGSTLNQAKRKFPKVFDNLYCNLIASGEQSGALDIMLQRICEYLEKSVKLRGQVKQAMMYPSFMFGFAIITTIFMLWMVVPTFIEIFEGLNIELPGPTLMVKGMSDFIKGNILFIFIGVIAFIFFLRYFKKTPPGKLLLDSIALRLPLFGALLEKTSLSRITRTLSTLLSGGVPMLESLKITSTTAGNVVLENRLIESRSMVSEGANLTDSFKEKGRFPFMLTQMVGVGEATGTLDSMLTKLADFYDEEIESTVGSLLSIMEPLLIVVVAGLIGGIIISMYLPIFTLMGTF